ncbi:MJ0307 family thioredoxin [Methanobrevibacter curvatus]|uniref:Glutaredoxin n=1 Tax=Methanobrevibacter curvatus TaxID=49547 RepID=A0A166A988_9EURY|nr:MJ0307 family thioredoxin [Methanobrevibacter curvatus]KZX11734.1 glutaredoxin [Methanobrevibacter curvatus]
MINVEVFTSSTCPYCPMAVEVVEEAKEKVGGFEYTVINIMEDRTKAVEYGIMAVPAIAINGVVEFVGAPTYEQLIEKL